jgi:2-phospho-L-lactate guanylyltransferase
MIRTANSSLPTTALIPLRGDGKSRLADALGPARRGGLVAAMLDDVLMALSGCGVSDVVILAGDGPAEDLASAHGLRVLRDPIAPTGAAPDGDGRLRAAVDAGLAVLPADAVRLVVAADLPRLSAAEIATVVADPADVVVVPTVGGGTAVLRLGPGVMIPVQYGRGSAGAHLRVADARDLTTSVLDLPGARHDVDAAADLTALIGPLDGTMPGPATAAFLDVPAG